MGIFTLNKLLTKYISLFYNNSKKILIDYLFRKDFKKKNRSESQIIFFGAYCNY